MWLAQSTNTRPACSSQRIQLSVERANKSQCWKPLLRVFVRCVVHERRWCWHLAVAECKSRRRNRKNRCNLKETMEYREMPTRNRKHCRATAKLAAYAKPLMLSTVGRKGKREGGWGRSRTPHRTSTAMGTGSGARAVVSSVQGGWTAWLEPMISSTSSNRSGFFACTRRK